MHEELHGFELSSLPIGEDNECEHGHRVPSDTLKGALVDAAGRSSLSSRGS